MALRDEMMMEPLEWEQAALAAGTDIEEVWKRRDLEERILDLVGDVVAAIDVGTQAVLAVLERHPDEEEAVANVCRAGKPVEAFRAWQAGCQEALRYIVSLETKPDDDGQEG
jgi:hypothetical protein